MSGRETGMTVVEVTVSLAILALVSSAVTLLISRTDASLSVARVRDQANELATDTIEEAKAFGCGLATGADTPAAAARWQRECWGGLGDSAYTNGRFTVTLHTAWRQIGAAVNQCAVPSNPPATADGLLRAVSVDWTTGHVAVTDYESVPPDAVAYRDTTRGAVLVRGQAGARASVSDGGSAVTHTIESSGCAFFPFLPAGTATWSMGPLSGPVPVQAGQVSTAP